MIRKLIVLIAVVLSIFSQASTEQKIFDGHGQFMIADGFSGDLTLAKARAKDRALDNARLHARIFVQSVTETQDLVATLDEIKTILANTIEIRGEPKFKIETEKIRGADVLIITCNLSAVVDDSNVINAFNDRKKLEQVVQQNKSLEILKEKNDLEIEELWERYLNSTLESEREQIRNLVKANNKDFTANQYIESGQRHYAAGRSEEAIEDYNRAIEIDPNNATAYNNRGVVYIGYNEFGTDEIALSDVNHAIELNPTNAIMYINRGAVYQNKNEYDKAFDDYMRAVNIDPNEPSIYLNRGSLYRSQGKQILALADYNHALELDPQNVSDQAMNDFNHAIQLDPKRSASYAALGYFYLELDDLDKSLENFNYALEINPKSGEAYLGRGKIYQLRGITPRMIDDYNRAIELSYRYFFHIDKNQVFVDINYLLQADPLQVRAIYLRGLINENMMNFKDAIADFTQVVKLQPKRVEAYYHRGITYMNLAIDNMAKAVDPYNYTDVESYRHAIEDLTRALELDPSLARKHDAYMRRANAYYYLNDFSKAAEDCRKALELTPNHERAQKFLQSIESIIEHRSN